MGVFYKTTKRIGKRSRSGRNNADGLSQAGKTSVFNSAGQQSYGNGSSNMESVSELIEEAVKSVVREYDTISEFPESGLPNTLYIDRSTGVEYRWNGDQYAVVGGYTAGDGIEIDGSVISNMHTHLTSEEIDEICV